MHQMITRNCLDNLPVKGFQFGKGVFGMLSAVTSFGTCSNISKNQSWGASLPTDAMLQSKNYRLWVLCDRSLQIGVMIPAYRPDEFLIFPALTILLFHVF